MKEGRNGITENTPKKILLGAGTIHRGLKFNESQWNFEASLIGSTKGGNKLEIKPETIDAGIDGQNVATKGLSAIKVGEEATLEVNHAEVDSKLLAKATMGRITNSTIDGYDLIESKSDIENSDYDDNIAFVGRTLEGKHIIIILDNAICTEGLELDNKNKDTTAIKLKYICTADPANTPELDKLPWRIYYPKIS